ncbi:MAG: hypothetical protein IID30_10665 [Planctomycetes bacterium]|nr:hypothetical protein [Planctomycetota bacterium]
MTRLLHNLAKSPSRTIRSVKRLFSPVYKLQRKSDRYVPKNFPAERIKKLEAVPGTSSACEGACSPISPPAPRSMKTRSSWKSGRIKASPPHGSSRPPKPGPIILPW